MKAVAVASRVNARQRIGFTKCATPHCRNPKARRPDGRSYGALCHKCRCRRWRANQPMRAAFLTLKSHATARGIEFALPFPIFARLASVSAYLTRTGLSGEALTVDRRDNLRGYVPGNVQVTRSENCVKQAKRDAIRMRAGFAWKGGRS